MNRRANLTKLVKIGNKWTYRRPVYTKKTGMLTSRVRHNGKDAELGGSFVLRWYENGHRRRRNLRTGDTLVAISELRKLQKLQEARADGVPVAESPQPGKQSLRQAVEEFLEEVRVNKAKKTWQAFKQVLETFVAACPHATVEGITRRDVMVHFVGALQDQGLSDRTQFHRFACLVSFLKANKCTVVTLKDAPDYTETKISVYTQDELKAFFAACDPDDLLDMARLLEARIVNRRNITTCPLCLEEVSAEGFFSKMEQAQGRAVLDLTVTQLSLFHIQELRTGVFNHRPYNVGWGHHHCNVVVKGSGIQETLEWMQTVLDRNRLLAAE